MVFLGAAAGAADGLSVSALALGLFLFDLI
jgi:hypothetical protein